jgi:hypothetical protein
MVLSSAVIGSKFRWDITWKSKGQNKSIVVNGESKIGRSNVIIRRNLVEITDVDNDSIVVKLRLINTDATPQSLGPQVEVAIKRGETVVPATTTRDLGGSGLTRSLPQPQGSSEFCYPQHPTQLSGLMSLHSSHPNQAPKPRSLGDYNLGQIYTNSQPDQAQKSRAIPEDEGEEDIVIEQADMLPPINVLDKIGFYRSSTSGAGAIIQLPDVTGEIRVIEVVVLQDPDFPDSFLLPLLFRPPVTFDNIQLAPYTYNGTFNLIGPEPSQVTVTAQLTLTEVISWNLKINGQNLQKRLRTQSSNPIQMIIVNKEEVKDTTKKTVLPCLILPIPKDDEPEVTGVPYYGSIMFQVVLPNPAEVDQAPTIQT